ncbi:hypothetical protein M9Y10_029902 [Tritrichomonas musculus]|uniref:Uncharacterized protein n=1 Tax=Tritrichomonas musculus TaxID=1915356 RepID=A0ABR2KP22_9EUKA
MTSCNIPKIEDKNNYLFSLLQQISILSRYEKNHEYNVYDHDDDDDDDDDDDFEVEYDEDEDEEEEDDDDNYNEYLIDNYIE